MKVSKRQRWEKPPTVRCKTQNVARLALDNCFVCARTPLHAETSRHPLPLPQLVPIRHESGEFHVCRWANDKQTSQHEPEVTHKKTKQQNINGQQKKPNDHAKNTQFSKPNGLQIVTTSRSGTYYWKAALFNPSDHTWKADGVILPRSYSELLRDTGQATVRSLL